MLPVLVAFGVAGLIAKVINNSESNSSGCSSSSNDDSDSGSSEHDNCDGPSSGDIPQPDPVGDNSFDFNPSEEAGEAFRSTFGDDNK